MALSKAFSIVAERLQEAAAAMSNEDVERRLSQAIRKAYEGKPQWCSVVSVFGNEEAGEVVFSCDGELMRAKYTLSSSKGKSSTTVDIENAKVVVPRVTYDLMEAETEQTEAKESAIALTESACELLGSVKLTEARADYEVKLIAPGKGSTAWYTVEALKNSGPAVFRAGTHMYWDHPTRSEEAERPERSMDTLAGIFTTDAVYREDGPKGEGLYARAKVFSDYAQKVEEKAPHTGLSIIAGGVCEMAGGKPVMREGVPVLKAFTSAQSTDFVTKAGAGGMVLTESAVDEPAEIKPKEGATEMDAAEFTKLQESHNALKAKHEAMLQRMQLSEAAGIVSGHFATMRVPDGIRARVSKNVLSGTIPVTEAGEIDRKKLTDLVESETKSELEYIGQLTGSPVRGMGASAPAQMTEAERQASEQELDAMATGFAQGMGVQSKEAAAIFRQGRSAFNPDFNAREVTR